MKKRRFQISAFFCFFAQDPLTHASRMFDLQKRSGQPGNRTLFDLLCLRGMTDIPFILLCQHRSCFGIDIRIGSLDQYDDQ